MTNLCKAQDADTIYHSYIMNGIIAGNQKSWKEGSHIFHYIIRTENGRYKNMSETLITDSASQIVSVTGRGVDFFNMPYDESFSIVNDSAIWTTNGMRKTKKYHKELYDRSISPGVSELALKWLLEQKNNLGIALPHDTLYAKRSMVKTISYEGKKNNLALYAIYYPPQRLPQYIWMTGDLHYFAGLYANGGYILKGYEKWIDTLFKLQVSADSDYYAQEMIENSTTLKSHLLITHANLFESSTASVMKDMSVEVMGGKIVSVFSSALINKIHVDSILDARGKFLMPGLWDMHCHFNPELHGLWNLVSGVTHIRDMGNADIIRFYQKQIRENKMLGPDISFISLLLDVKPNIGVAVSSEMDALLAIDHYRLLGYDQLKIYNGIKPEWTQAMIDRAHSLGMRVAGHIPDGMSTHQAITAGYNEITHINSLYLDFIDDDSLKKTGMQFGRIAARCSGMLDLKGDTVKQFIQLLKEKSITVDPTIRLHEDRFIEYKGDSSNMYKPIVNWMPESEKYKVVKDNSYGTENEKPLFLASYQNNLKLIKLLFDNGIRIVAGTDDSYGGFSLIRELEIYNAAGIPANEVLKIATFTAAQDCNLEEKYGQILVGREADFILIDGDPINRLSDIRRVNWVIKKDRMYQPKILLASQGWTYYY